MNNARYMVFDDDDVEIVPIGDCVISRNIFLAQNKMKKMCPTYPTLSKI